MEFKSWLALERLTLRDALERITAIDPSIVLSVAQLSRLANRLQWPRPELIRAVHMISDGKVDANAWAGIAGDVCAD